MENVRALPLGIGDDTKYQPVPGAVCGPQFTTVLNVSRVSICSTPGTNDGKKNPAFAVPAKDIANGTDTRPDTTAATIRLARVFIFISPKGEIEATQTIFDLREARSIDRTVENDCS